MAKATYPLLRRRRRRAGAPRLRFGRYGRVAALAVLAGAVLFGAIALRHRQSPPDAHAALAAALASLDAGNYSAARNHARIATNAAPRSGLAHAVLARAYLELGDGLAAEAELTRARDVGLPAARLYQLQAQARLLQGDPDGALAEAMKASPRYAAYAARVAANAQSARHHVADARATLLNILAANPRDAAAWRDLGRIRFEAGDIGGAADAAARAVNLDARDPATLTLEGEIVRSRYGLVASLPWFRAAIARDAYHYPALIDYAATLGDLGRYAEMLAATRAAMAARPGSPQALYLQATLAARAGRPELARSLLAQAGGALDTVPGAVLLSGSLDYAEGKYEQAIQQWRRLVAMQPMNVVARRLLAAAMLRSGDANGALDMLRPIVLRADADSYSLSLVAAAFAATGDRATAARYRDRAAVQAKLASVPFATDDALEALAAGTAQAPGDPTYVLGLIRGQIGNGQTGAAIAQARALVTASPGAAAAQLAYGDTLAAAGRYGDAAAAFGRAADLSFDEPTMLRLVDALGRAGRPRDASAALALYLTQNPQSVAARRLLGQLQVAAGRWDAAIETLEALRGAIGNRDAGLLSQLAYAYAGAGQGDVARRYGRAAYALAPMTAGVVDAYGVALAADGDADGARQLLDKAATLAPGDAAIAAHRRQIGG